MDLPVRLTKNRVSILLIALMLLLSALTGISGAASKRPETTLGLPAHSSLLFALDAGAGTMEPERGSAGSDHYRLELEGVDPRTVWFADRPRRDAGRLATGGFFAGWGHLGFRSDPPNAALVAQVGGRTRTMAVELKLRRYDRRSRDVAFDARVLGSLGGGLRHLNRSLGAALPEHFSAPTLFVDNGGAEPSCTLGETRLMAISPGSEGNIEGMIPADGRTLEIAEHQALFSLWETTFGGNGQTTFGVPRLSAPAGTTWFVCDEGFYPQSPDLTPLCTLGQTSFWVLPLGVRDVTSWLPADGRRISALEYPQYAQRFAASGETQVALPTATGPPGTTALTCVSSEAPEEPPRILGQLVLLPSVLPNQQQQLAPASGGSVAPNSPISALLAADTPLGGRVPNLPSAGPLADWYISYAGSWPLS